MSRRVLLAATAIAASVVVVRGALLEPMALASASMAPTLHEGDTVLVNKLGPRLDGVDIGDIVVFASPEDGGDVIKRVVAVGGQEVALRDAVLHVDGVAVHEPQVDLSRIDGTWFGPVTVPEDSVFVMGDSRAGSIDSRVYGGVPLESVKGTVVTRIWPLS